MASSAREPQYVGPITLDELLALNDEIAALVRVGVPLEQGLQRLAEEMPGRCGRTASLLAERLQQGIPLEQVLAENPQVFPPVYRAMVEAGMRSGRLSAALETVARSARRLAEARTAVAQGFIYPLLVFLIGWGLLVFFSVAIAPRFLSMIREIEHPSYGLGLSKAVLTGLYNLAPTAAIWGLAVPAIVVFLATMWWMRARCASLMQTRVADALLGWLPWTGRMLRTYRVATLTDLLASLLEHSVPLDRALELSAGAVGEPGMIRAAERAAEAVRRGEPLESVRIGGAALPPLLRWLMAAGAQRGAMAASVRHAAEVYRQRAAWQGETARVFLPILLTLAIGGTVTLLYALLVLGSWFAVMRSLG